MKVAVITPYHVIDSNLSTCLESIQKQTHSNLIHILVGDGCDIGDTSNFKNVFNISLPKNIGDYGDSPRSIGVIFAKSFNVDAFAFLDSDNWFETNHIENMMSTAIKNNSDVVSCQRNICHLNGQVMGVCPESNGIKFCDTNCMFITKRLLQQVASWWLIPDDLHVIDDRVIWDRLVHATDRITLITDITVNYRSTFKFHYDMFGYACPIEAKPSFNIMAKKNEIDRFSRRSLMRMKHIFNLKI